LQFAIAQVAAVRSTCEGISRRRVRVEIAPAGSGRKAAKLEAETAMRIGMRFRAFLPFADGLDGG
jgi:hypothetical protein